MPLQPLAFRLQPHLAVTLRAFNVFNRTNFGEPGNGPILEEGTVLAIEPMVNAGGPLVRMGEDGWAVYSQDGSLAAHFEFTVAVTVDGPRILTPWHEDADPFKWTATADQILEKVAMLDHDYKQLVANNLK